MFIAALFILAKLWNQQRCLTTDEWLKKYDQLYILHIYRHTCTCAMEYYSVIKKNETMYFAEKWIKLRLIMLSERIQA
jgi:hypothetical protein